MAKHSADPRLSRYLRQILEDIHRKPEPEPSESLHDKVALGLATRQEEHEFALRVTRYNNRI